MRPEEGEPCLELEPLRLRREGEDFSLCSIFWPFKGSGILDQLSRPLREEER